MTVLPIALVAVVAVTTTAWGILGLVVLMAVLLGAGAFVYLRHRMGLPEATEEDLPPLLYSPPAVARPAPPAPMRVAAAAAPPQVRSPSPTPKPARVPRKTAPDVAGTPARPPAKRARKAPVPSPAGAPEAAESGEEVHVAQVHFHRPPEGTLQLLPGRLEILSGTDRVDEIRFLKLPGRDPEITFGRSTGEPHAHVQLEVPTVSRMHARMIYRGGRWRIANLSRTNPIVVNGEQLPLDEEESAVLEDGDRVEMGQVVFRFRMR